MEDIYQFAFGIFSPMILKNYRYGQINEDRDTTLENHKCMLAAIERRNFFTGIQAIETSAMLWKKWIEKQDNEMTYGQLL
jgi:hypothetical protein